MTSKYLLGRCLNPQIYPEKAFRGSKHLLTYLEDFECRNSTFWFPDHFPPRKCMANSKQLLTTLAKTDSSPLKRSWKAEVGRWHVLFGLPIFESYMFFLSGSVYMLEFPNLGTPWSKYMAQSPKGRWIQGWYKPIQGNCAIYFYPGVCDPTSIWKLLAPNFESETSVKLTRLQHYTLGILFHIQNPPPAKDRCERNP